MTAAAPAAAASETQRRTVRVLAGSQALGAVGVSGGIAVGGLVAEEVSGSTALSGLAQTAAVLGAALAALPMSRLMAARGRRPGLVAGYAAGALGAALVIASAVVRSFPLQLVGTALFGAATAANLQARFAATDLAAPAGRGRALSTVVWATTVGAVLGPNLFAPGGSLARALGLPELAGPYLFSLLSFLLGGLTVHLLLRPDPLLEARRLAGTAGAPAPRRSLRASLAVVSASPPAVLGLAAVVLGHAAMTAVMVMTPVHMRHGGAGLSVVGIVISVHVGGMYALAPLVGWLADRLGRVPVVLGAQGVLLTAVLVAGTSASSALLGVGLFLLGLGWSGALVAGSTLLSESVPLAERPAVQGGADFAMGIGAAAAGAAAGLVLGTAGYGGLNALTALLVVPVLLLAAYVGRPAPAPA